MTRSRYVWLISAILSVVFLPLSMRLSAAETSDKSGDEVQCRVRITIASPLEFSNTPLDPVIDFSSLIRDAGLPGVLDPNSIDVVDANDGQSVDHAITDDFAQGDRGRVEWVVQDPTHTEYDLTFRVVPKRPELASQSYVPPIGVGDLLRYNAGEPRPIACPSSPNLVDLRGTGRADLVGGWNYAYRPGDPWDGIICYPRVGNAEQFVFGDLYRLRYVDKPGAKQRKHFTHLYASCDFADLNRDGRVDLVFGRKGTATADFYLNSGDIDASGMPLFTPSGSTSAPDWEALRAVDLNSDGACDLVAGGHYIKNLNSAGWPFQPDKPVVLDAGREPCFVDLDGDGRLDAVCLAGKTAPRLQGEGVVAPWLDNIRIGWRRNLGGDPPKFAPERPIPGIDLRCCTSVAAAQEAGKTLLVVQYDYYQRIAIFQRDNAANKLPRFKRRADAASNSAVLALSDQAWPCLCDWNADGVFDLLVGGGYGFPRILINEGTMERPSWAEPKLIKSKGKPIRFLRNDILGKPNHWHNMGYSYPVFVRWDDDDLPDLVCPNETNRIFWYKNIGTKTKPRFRSRQQVMVEGFGESRKRRATSAQRAVKNTYPPEKESPFFWRTGAALADFNGDGLTDLVTLDGENRRATLFARFRNSGGQLRLRNSEVLKLSDGRPIDDSIVGRAMHWAEAFRAIDWDSDGLMDLVYSLASGGTDIQDNGSIYWLRNCGTKIEPVFEPPVTLRCFGKPIRVTAHGPMAWPGDFDGDGRPDLIACTEWSVYPFYRHAALMMKERPKIELGKLKVLR